MHFHDALGQPVDDNLENQNTGRVSRMTFTVLVWFVAILMS